MDSKAKVVLTFPLESFFADLLKKAFEGGYVEKVPWPQPPSPAISGRDEDSVTKWEDVVEVDKSGEKKEQPAEDAAEVSAQPQLQPRPKPQPQIRAAAQLAINFRAAGSKSQSGSAKHQQCVEPPSGGGPRSRG